MCSLEITATFVCTSSCLKSPKRTWRYYIFITIVIVTTLLAGSGREIWSQHTRKSAKGGVKSFIVFSSSIFGVHPTLFIVEVWTHTELFWNVLKAEGNTASLHWCDAYKLIIQAKRCLIHTPAEMPEPQFSPFFFTTIQNHGANCDTIENIYNLHQHWHFFRRIAGFPLVPHGRTISP